MFRLALRSEMLGWRSAKIALVSRRSLAASSKPTPPGSNSSPVEVVMPVPVKAVKWTAVPVRSHNIKVYFPNAIASCFYIMFFGMVSGQEPQNWQIDAARHVSRRRFALARKFPFAAPPRGVIVATVVDDAGSVLADVCPTRRSAHVEQ